MNAEAMWARVQDFVRQDEETAVNLEEVVHRLKCEFPNAMEDEIERCVLQAALSKGSAVFWAGRSSA